MLSIGQNGFSLTAHTGFSRIKFLVSFFCLGGRIVYSWTGFVTRSVTCILARWSVRDSKFDGNT